MGSFNQPRQELDIKIDGRPKLKLSMIGQTVVDLIVYLDLMILVGVFSWWFEIEMNDRSEMD